MAAFEWDNNAPFARCKGESRKANLALRHYRAMGEARSLRALLERYQQQASNEGTTEKPPTKYWWTLSNWSFRHKWQDRLKRQEQLDAEADDARWAARRIEWHELDWTDGERLRLTAQDMAEFLQKFKVGENVHVETDVQEDGTTVITRTVTRFVKPDVRIDQVARATKLASELQRQAAQIAPQIQQVEVDVSSDLQAAILGQLARLADTEPAGDNNSGLEPEAAT